MRCVCLVHFVSLRSHPVLSTPSPAGPALDPVAVSSSLAVAGASIVAGLVESRMRRDAKDSNARVQLQAGTLLAVATMLGGGLALLPGPSAAGFRSALTALAVLWLAPAGRPERFLLSATVCATVAAATSCAAGGCSGVLSLLLAAALLIAPQLLRKPVARWVGRSVAEDVRRGAGPCVLQLSVAAALFSRDISPPPAGWAGKLLQLGVVSYAGLMLLGTVAAPDPPSKPTWPPPPVSGSSIHASLMKLAAAFLVLSVLTVLLAV